MGEGVGRALLDRGGDCYTIKWFPSMAIEYDIRDGRLLWIRNPYSGVVSYVVDMRGKSFAFTLGKRRAGIEPGPPPHSEAIARAIADCPFCPGNEGLTPAELVRVQPGEVSEWHAEGTHRHQWVIRALKNLFPRIPAELTDGQNESYIVIEDPRHFAEPPRSLDDLMWTGALSEEQFHSLIATDVKVMRLALANASVRSVVIRKNQGAESGASQPHLHHQVIGSPGILPALEAEARVIATNPDLWPELIGLADRLGLILEQGDGVVTFQSPIGTFPRSYDIVVPAFRGLLTELQPVTMHAFARALHRMLHVLGPLPLDYEIHQGADLPLHAHLNARLFPYSNVAGTLNLPGTIIDGAAAIRHALERI